MNLIYPSHLTIWIAYEWQKGELVVNRSAAGHDLSLVHELDCRPHRNRRERIKYLLKEGNLEERSYKPRNVSRRRIQLHTCTPLCSSRMYCTVSPVSLISSVPGRLVCPRFLSALYLKYRSLRGLCREAKLVALGLMGRAPR